MATVMGYDGGATKTRCVICTGGGVILADEIAGPSNYHIVGLAACARVIRELWDRCLAASGLEAGQVDYIYLGLSGADLPEDFQQLNTVCREIFESVPFTVDNDCWISLRSGLEGRWGAVSICGTGSNAAAVNPQGERTILRALTYEVGNFGGGGDLAKLALHKAFRADDGVGVPTLLQDELPRLFGSRDMVELLNLVFPEPKYEENIGAIPPLVFALASRGDRVCQDLLLEMGRAMGEAVSAVIRKVGMAELAVPVVLGGSLYRGSNPLLIDELTTTLHRTAPWAEVTVPNLPPAAGACLLALDQLDIVLGREEFNQLGKGLD